MAEVGPELVDEAEPGPSPMDVLTAPAGVLPLTVIPDGVADTEKPNPGTPIEVDMPCDPVDVEGA